VRSRWLDYFGLPHIIQSDNGTEFKNKLFVESISCWDGDGRTHADGPHGSIQPQTVGKAPSLGDVQPEYITIFVN